MMVNHRHDTSRRNYARFVMCASAAVMLSLFTVPASGTCSTTTGSAHFETNGNFDGWTEVELSGGSNISVSDGHLLFDFGASEHVDAGGGVSEDFPGLDAPRVEIETPSGDFTILAKVDTNPMIYDDAEFAGGGFVLIDDNTSGTVILDSARTDIYFLNLASQQPANCETNGNCIDDEVYAWAQVGDSVVSCASDHDGSTENDPLGDDECRRPLNPVSFNHRHVGWPSHQRLVRDTGEDHFVFSTSYDGSDWVEVARITGIDPDRIGFMAYKGETEGGAEAVTIAVDYLEVRADTDCDPNTPTPGSVRTTILTETFGGSWSSNWQDDSGDIDSSDGVDNGSASVASNTLTLTTETSKGSTGRILSNSTYPADVGAKLRLRNNGTTDAKVFLGIGLRSTNGWAGQYAPNEGYVFEANPVESIIRLARVAGPHSSPDGAKWSYILENDDADADFNDCVDDVNNTNCEWVWIRFEVTDQVVRYRVWSYGDSEPGTWISANTGYDHVVRGPGKVGLALSHNSNESVEGTIEIKDLEIYATRVPCEPIYDCGLDGCQHEYPLDCTQYDTGDSGCFDSSGYTQDCPSGETIWVKNCACEWAGEGFGICLNEDQSWTCLP